MINVSIIILVLGAITFILFGIAIGTLILRKPNSDHQQQEKDAIIHSVYQEIELLVHISQETEKLHLDQAQLLSSIKRILILEEGIRTSSADDKRLEELHKEWEMVKKHFVELGKRFNTIDSLLDEIADKNEIKLDKLQKSLNINSQGGPVFMGEVDNRGNIQGRFAGDPSTDAPPPPPKK